MCGARVVSDGQCGARVGLRFGRPVGLELVWRARLHEGGGYNVFMLVLEVFRILIADDEDEHTKSEAGRTAS